MSKLQSCCFSTLMQDPVLQLDTMVAVQVDAELIHATVIKDATGRMTVALILSKLVATVSVDL